jgi:mono/diheme cytochrome c family protein
MATARRYHLDAVREIRVRRRPSALAVGAVLAVVGALGALGAGCTGGEVPAPPAGDAVLEQGRAVYGANCVNCHGRDGGGGQGTRLNGGHVLEAYPEPADQLEVVAGGRRAMPAFGEKLTADELEAVVRYTREVLAEQ